MIVLFVTLQHNFALNFGGIFCHNKSRHLCAVLLNQVVNLKKQLQQKEQALIEKEKKVEF